MWDLLAKSDMDRDIDKIKIWPTAHGHCPHRHVTASRREAHVQKSIP
jgi:hypothetical protein